MTRNPPFRFRIRLDPVLALLILTMAFCEVALTLGDLGWLGERSFRNYAYQQAGFWPGLLYDWEPNYAGQAYLMFFTYAFLHGGTLHFVVNVITLFSLGRGIIDRVGRTKFCLIYMFSIFGGAFGYAALYTTPQPMVGASGALFGLAGAWLAWEYVDRFAARSALWPVARVVAMLIALNVVMYFSLNGQLAWQTHLGGFITGWIAATLFDPRARDIDEDEDKGP